MRKTILALALSMAALTAPAAAQIYDHNTPLPGMNHSMLASSDPADGAVLDQAPQVLTLNFQHFVTLQTATIKSGDGTSAALAWRRQQPRPEATRSRCPRLPMGPTRSPSQRPGREEPTRCPGAFASPSANAHRPTQPNLQSTR